MPSKGLGASQFALTGVVDQVPGRGAELADGQSDHVILASADPANPYGQPSSGQPVNGPAAQVHPIDPPGGPGATSS